MDSNPVVSKAQFGWCGVGRLRGLIVPIVVASTLFAVGQNSVLAAGQPKREMLFPDSAVIRPELPNAPSYEPLTPKQKFGRFLDDGRSPYVFGGAMITAITWQWKGHPPFGTGSVGFGKGFAAAVAQRETSIFLSRFLLPTVFRQDPRYFPAAEGSSKFHRAAYAASRVFMTRSDSGGQTWNAAYILGNLGSAGIANLYISNRDAGTIFSDFAVGMGTDAGYNIIREFWPAMRKRIPGKRTKQLGDLIIGKNKIESPTQDESPKK